VPVVLPLIADADGPIVFIASLQPCSYNVSLFVCAILKFKYLKWEDTRRIRMFLIGFLASRGSNPCTIHIFIFVYSLC